MVDPYVREDETLDTLFHGRIRILQKRSGYRLAMDPVLLAHFAWPLRGGRILDLGTGSGVIPLILATRDPGCRVVGLEIQADMVEMARRSVRLNALEDRVRILEGDYRRIREIFPPQSFDHVTCNPPYHPRGAGRSSSHASKAGARHELSGSLGDALEAARYVLGTKGRLWLTYTPTRLGTLLRALGEANLEPKRLRMVHGRRDLPARLLLLEAVRGGREGLEVLPPLILYHRGNVYTEELQEIYRMI